MTSKHQVIDCHFAHPDWSSDRIAADLGCRPEYVRATLSRAKLKLMRSQGKHGKSVDAQVADALAKVLI